MTTKIERYDAFALELAELCKRHGVQIDSGYSDVIVYDRCEEYGAWWQNSVPENRLNSSDTPAPAHPDTVRLETFMRLAQDGATPEQDEALDALVPAGKAPTSMDELRTFLDGAREILK